jgi:phosphomannomutase / phosphoglucomutase
MKINHDVFREYDIRGFVDKDLSNSFAYLLGRAFGVMAKEVLGKQKDVHTRIGVGYDCRESSPGYAEHLAMGLSDAGHEAVVIGMCPTPQLYFSLYELNLDGGIQVTGSHNPSDMNGFKMCIGKSTIAGKEIQILKEKALQIVAEENIDEKISSLSSRQYHITKLSTQERYIDSLIENSKPFMGKRKLKVVCDAGNGVGGLIGPKVLSKLGVEVIEMYCDPDGRFPNHHPDPTVPKYIVDLVNKVKECKADFGIAWDGDADRIGVVDEQGEMIYGDMLLLLYAREILKTVPKPTVIGDVKCSSRLFSTLQKEGANAIMWKTGHSLIKQKLKETSGDLAGEMSGHIFFKHRYYGYDDALYASARFCEIVSNTEKNVSALLADLPIAYSTPEIRVDCPEEIKFKVPEMAKKSFPEYTVDTIDGARINFEDGWGLVRASNTQPVLVMRFESQDKNNLTKYQNLVTSKIEEIKRTLQH